MGWINPWACITPSHGHFHDIGGEGVSHTVQPSNELSLLMTPIVGFSLVFLLPLLACLSYERPYTLDPSLHCFCTALTHRKAIKKNMLLDTQT